MSPQMALAVRLLWKKVSFVQKFELWAFVAPITIPLHYGAKIMVLVSVCYAATQPAIQLQQECIQVVRRNKKAQKRPTESNGTAAMDAWS